MTLPTTRDTLYAGALTLEQPARGYRFNVDSLLLADFAGGRSAALCVDLGAGVGTVALALHHLGRARQLELVELDPEIALIARRNLTLAGASGDVHAHDVAKGLPRALRQRADLVVSNPPFFDPAAHRPPREPRAQKARSGALDPFVDAAAQALAGPRARALFAYPARSLTQLFGLAGAHGLEPKRLRLVHADSSSPARLALVELRRGRAGGLVVEAPLYEWSEKGRRSPELSLILEGRAGDRT